MSKAWTYVLFAFSALFFIMASYYLVMMLFVLPHFHLFVAYKVVAGYFLALVLYWIAARKKKKRKLGGGLD